MVNYVFVGAWIAVCRKIDRLATDMHAVYMCISCVLGLIGRGSPTE